MRRLAPALALVWLLAACAGGGEGAGGTAASEAPEAPASPAEGLDPTRPPADDDAAAAPTPRSTPGEQAGTAPFEGAVATVDGGSLAGADFVRRDVALWFWAPW